MRDDYERRFGQESDGVNGVSDHKSKDVLTFVRTCRVDVKI